MDSIDGVRILIVEDDQRLAALTRDFLEANRFNVSTEGNGTRAVTRILQERPDLVVLDLMLPGEDGVSICKKVRSSYQGAILMLTARTDDVDQIVGLEVGADDYVAKPVQPRVLLARIRALLRRQPTELRQNDLGIEQQRLVFSDLILDCRMREAWLAGKIIELTSAEFDLLWLLCSNAGRILSRDEIFSQLRGISYDGQDRSIDVRVSRIRPKIGDDPEHPRLIKTVRNRGYLFVSERN